MICPHCNKEVDSYISIKADSGVNLNLNGGCASGLVGYTYTVANAAALPAGTNVLDVTGCANQGNLNTHYHMI